MNLYRISQTTNEDYDTFSDAVVCAESADDARDMNPATGRPMTGYDWAKMYSFWCGHRDQVAVVFLGIADQSVKHGVVCASYHAG